MRQLQVAVLLLLTAAFVVTFSNTTTREKPRSQIIPAVTIERSDLDSDLDERSHLMRASRAYSRYVAASANTTTLPIVTTTPTAKPKSHTHVTTAPKPVTAKSEIPGGDIWQKLANCESTMNQRATSSSGTYLGYFQFSRATWQSVGGPGDPRDHDYATQLYYAQILQARSGWGQWPHCSKKLGLR